MCLDLGYLNLNDRRHRKILTVNINNRYSLEELLTAQTDDTYNDELTNDKANNYAVK